MCARVRKRCRLWRHLFHGRETETMLWIKLFIRIAVIVCAVILTVVSAITIGIINDNEDINDIRNPTKYDSLEQLQDLVAITLTTAEWLIAFNIIVLVWEIVHIILPAVSSRSSFLQRYSVVIMVMDIGFSFVAMVCFLASMIACVAHADSWGEPPEACDSRGKYYKQLDCDHTHLEGTNGTAAFVCVLQVGLFSALTVIVAISQFPKMLVFLQGLGTGKSNKEEELQPGL